LLFFLQRRRIAFPGLQGVLGVTSYEIFSGRIDSDPLWLESVEGKEAACARMKQRANEAPGPYFIFSASAQQIIASLDTSDLDGQGDGQAKVRGASQR
jgi:hypothetical protein